MILSSAPGQGNLYALTFSGGLKRELIWLLAVAATTRTWRSGVDGTIYVGGEDVVFYAINRNGSQKWVSRLMAPIIARIILHLRSVPTALSISARPTAIYAIGSVTGPTTTPTSTRTATATPTATTIATATPTRSKTPTPTVAKTADSYAGRATRTGTPTSTVTKTATPTKTATRTTTPTPVLGGLVTLLPSTLNFGTITLGQVSASSTVTLTNGTGKTLDVRGTGIGLNFVVVGSTCPAAPVPVTRATTLTSAAKRRNEKRAVPSQKQHQGAGSSFDRRRRALAVSFCDAKRAR